MRCFSPAFDIKRGEFWSNEANPNAETRKGRVVVPTCPFHLGHCAPQVVICNVIISGAYFPGQGKKRVLRVLRVHKKGEFLRSLGKCKNLSFGLKMSFRSPYARARARGDVLAP
jgi:hypothetical protein